MFQHIIGFRKQEYYMSIKRKEFGMKPVVKSFFDKPTWTVTYVAFDQNTKDAVIIDPVWDYDPAASKMSTESAEQVLDFVRAKELRVHYILETHAHADHVSGSQILKEWIPGAKVAIGANIREVQRVFKSVFNLSPEFQTDGSQFDQLLNENEVIKAGSLAIKTIYTPGHTPACSSYVIGDAVFVGDAVFMPDYGTGRCDFPAGSAEDLYTSVHDKLYKLPDETRVFVGHDYQPGGRPVAFETTIGEEKRSNIQLSEKTTREEFVAFRNRRDESLAAPRLLLPSVQVNIDAGHLPKAESNGVSYLKIPVRK
jgi:glyoxylase-like metal-dependent hydrolase (beta-lactamase superfamily II)